MGRKLNLVKHMSKQELEAKYKQEKNPRVKERLLAILLLYEGKKVSELPSIIKRSRTSIEDWIKRWNKQGYQGLIPHFTGGPKPKISDWDKVIDEIENKGMTFRCRSLYQKFKRGHLLLQDCLVYTQKEKQGKIW
jgi:transposase